MGQFLREELAAGRGYLPAGEQVFRAFQRPLADVRVLVVGQDPYPTPATRSGSASRSSGTCGRCRGAWSTSTASCATTSGSMPPRHGDLTAWADQGVMLLNRVLTVRPGESASHRGRGWEEVTERAIDALVERGGPAVAILWGRDAQSLKPMLGGVPWVESAHPSPLSASRGFFGSRPFARSTGCSRSRAPRRSTGRSRLPE